jgi:hypothetical protein
MKGITLLTSLTLIAGLFCSMVSAEDTTHVVSGKSDKQAVTVSIHGKTRCVLLEGEVICSPVTFPNSMLMASASR